MTSSSTLNMAVWADGSDAPEKPVLNLGFMPLTDAAPLIVAATQGFGQPYGLTLNLERQASWAAISDRLGNGLLDAAQMLYGQVYGLQLGLSATALSMRILLGLSQNGQSIHLAEHLRQQGITQGTQLRKHICDSRQQLVLAHTYPTGTHAMWLYYWLAAQGIHPLNDVDTRVVPPAQMVAHLRAGRIDGFCAGDPWGALAIDEQQGFTLATSQQIWPDHPEKVLGVTAEFAARYPNTVRALTLAVLEAAQFIDASDENRSSTAQLLCGPDYVDAPLSCLLPRLLGDYADGLGNTWHDAHRVRFCAEGRVGFPWLSDGIWFLTQFRRWGLLEEDPDYFGMARAIHALDGYREAAAALGLPCPGSDLRTSRLMDGTLWSCIDPAAYARSFAIHALSSEYSSCE